MNSGKAQFVDRARQSLDERLTQTSPHIAACLRAARHEALESRRRRHHTGWLPAMVTAALVTVMVSGTWFARSPGPESVVMVGLEQREVDFEMLTGSDDLELYTEMDFYLWLDEWGLDAG